jgi:hypothetical protein
MDFEVRISDGSDIEIEEGYVACISTENNTEIGKVYQTIDAKLFRRFQNKLRVGRVETFFFTNALKKYRVGCII